MLTVERDTLKKLSWEEGQALQKNGGPARHKSDGQVYSLNNPRWASFPKNKIGPK